MLVHLFVYRFERLWSIDFPTPLSIGAIASQFSFLRLHISDSGPVTGGADSSAPTKRSSGPAGTWLLLCMHGGRGPLTLVVRHRL